MANANCLAFSTENICGADVRNSWQRLEALPISAWRAVPLEKRRLQALDPVLGVGAQPWPPTQAGPKAKEGLVRQAGNENWNDPENKSIQPVVSFIRESPKTGSFPTRTPRHSLSIAPARSVWRPPGSRRLISEHTCHRERHGAAPSAI